MLSKNRRLSSLEVKTVLKTGKSVATEAITAKILAVSSSTTAFPSRFAFLIPSKEIKSAAERNRLRRRLRAAVWSQRMHLPDNYWVVFIARRRLAAFSFSQLTPLVLSLMKRVPIINFEQ